MSPPASVFISYSHRDKDFKDRLVTQLRVLERVEVLAAWDDERIDLGDEWRRQIEQAMATAGVAVLLVSADFLSSGFILGEEVPRLLERRSQGLRLVPVIARDCAWQQVPWLAALEVFKKGAVLGSGDADLADLAREIARLLEPAAARGAAPDRPRPGSAAPDVSISRLPNTGRALFGRERELALLDRAWAEPGTHVLSLEAWGGVGKSALVKHWLGRLAKERYRGAALVFGWSFYSQGTSEAAASADSFIEAALRKLGDLDPAAGAAWDRGERLARLVREQRTLLILDGLEPLQHPPGPLEGEVKDRALKALLLELAAQNPGLAVITTRLPVADLASFEGQTVERIELEHLTPAAGARLLREQGVEGSDAELEQAAQEFDGHCLALTLLGSYLHDTGQHVSRRGEIGPLEREERHGGQARRVMAAYERWFGDGPELAVLRLLGLFKRPAPGGAITALREPPAIAGVTEALQGLRPRDWNRTLTRLRRARLLAEALPKEPDALDAHPLVREHFAEQLKAESLGAWREAHGRLFEYFKQAARPFPETLEEIAPLYAAVAHGCEAGRHFEALDEVYWTRILRKKEFFATEKLGAISSDLAALAGFFESPWSRLAGGLDESDQAFLLHQVGFRLRALGFLRDAAVLMKAALESRIAQQTWRRAAITAGNLSELHLSLGELPQALAEAQRGVDLADRSEDPDERVISRAILADALHQAGSLDEAEQRFQEAEELQRAAKPEHPSLNSLEGFRYCELLLAKGELAEVERRADLALAWAQADHVLLAIAVSHLSLGRAAALRCAAAGSVDFTRAAEHLDHAVAGLRQAGTQHHLPHGLLARADLHRLRGDRERALADLEAALAVAERSSMRLCEADCHLGLAQVHLARGARDEARVSLGRGRALIEATGYRRRVGRLAELARLLAE